MNSIFVLAAEGPNGYFIPSDVKEFWWGLVAFLIVAGLLVWKALPLGMKALDDAREKAVSDASAAEGAMLRSQAEATRLREELGDADAAGAQLVAEAQQTAAQIRADGATRIEQSIADTRARGANDIEAMRTQAAADIQAEIGAKALGAAEAVVSANLDDSTQASLIDDYIAKIGANA